MKKFALRLIDLYKKYLSPINFGKHTCRFAPSCADYTKEAIEKYGVSVGLAKGIWRIIRCNPWNKGGIDLP
jgi:uncharacterized protein